MVSSPGSDATAAPPSEPVPAVERTADLAARPWQLTPGWQVTVTLAWVSVCVALAAVWSTSRQLGLSTWWLGPPSQPRAVWLALTPFAPPAIVALLALTGRRYVPWAGLVAATCIAGVAAGDLGRVTGLGVLELVIACAGALVSIASFAGTYRSVRHDGPTSTPHR
jgi:hypothetical protein